MYLLFCCWRIKNKILIAAVVKPFISRFRFKMWTIVIRPNLRRNALESVQKHAKILFANVHTVNQSSVHISKNIHKSNYLSDKRKDSGLSGTRGFCSSINETKSLLGSAVVSTDEQPTGTNGCLFEVSAIFKVLKCFFLF